MCKRKHIAKSSYVNIYPMRILLKLSKRGDALSPQILSFPLQYSVRNIQESQVRL